MEKEILTQEQINFINKPTIAGLLGPIYALATELYRQFWLFFIPFYNIYVLLKLIRYGRKMAWEKTDRTYASFYSQQKKLSQITKILFGITLALFLVEFTVLFGLIFAGGGASFGKDVAKSFLQSEFTGAPVSDYTSPSFVVNQKFIDFQKETRGDYASVFFTDFSRSNDKSTLQGSMKFTNTSIPVCVQLSKFGQEFKVTSLSESCDQ